ncbi:hypothetical protein OROMI_017033 [Orobanche minor]
MSTIAAILVLRSAETTARISAVRLTDDVKPRTAPSPFRISSQKPLSARIFRSPVEMSSISVLSMLPNHSALLLRCSLPCYLLHLLVTVGVYNYETAILPMKRPGLFSRGSLLRPCRGILLFGLLGTGKSLLAKAIATEIKANFINVSAASITFKWLEKTSSALFSYAKKLAPVVIYLDKVDSFLGARGKNETSILKGFMAAWDGLKLKESQRVLVIGGTNRPFNIDEAVICRMPSR